MNGEKKTLFTRIKHMGPAAIVSAALIGPGTITTSGLSGCNYGFALVWCVLFSVVAMVITQQMTGRIGLAGGIGLAQAIRKSYQKQTFYWPLAVLLILAFFVSNCAYQASNVVGAASGVSVIVGEHRLVLCILITVVALALVMTGSIDRIGKVLTAVVLAMVVLFLTTAVAVRPNLGEVIKGMFSFSIPQGGQFTAIALIGTTMTPYCLYLHSDSHASERAQNPGLDVDDSLIDNTLASIINALIMFCVSTSIMIVGHALALNGGSIVAVTDLANGLQPLVGSYAQIIFAVGIFAAGISSATCAPLAATYIICGVLGWSTDLKDKRFRLICAFVFVVGCIFAIVGGAPTTIITTAQAIGGVALPISVILVLLVANKENVVGKYVNGKALNVLGIFVFVITLIMAYRTFSTTIPTILSWFQG